MSLYNFILNLIFILHDTKCKFFLNFCIAASEPFAVSQETTNILNRNNSNTERESHEEPPSK